MSLRLLDRLLPQCQCGTLPILVPIGVTLFTGRPHGSKKKGDLVLYYGDLFPTEARKPPSCPLVKQKIDLYCRGFPLVKPASADVRPGEYCHRSRVHTIPGVALAQKLDPAAALGLPIY